MINFLDADTDSAAGKVVSIEQMAYRKLTDAPSRLTNGRKVDEKPV